MSALVRFLDYLLNPRAAMPGPPEAAEAEGKWWQGLVLSPSLLVGALITLALILVFFLGPFWATENPYLNPFHMRESYYDTQSNRLIDPPLAPSEQYPLGTDARGNDNLSKLLFGARLTLMAAAFITLGRLVLGLLLGSLAGWRAGTAIDRGVMRLVSFVTAVPMLISGMLLIYALGIHRGLLVFVVALALVGWTEIAQQVRSEFLVLRKKLFVEAARSSGMSDLQIVVRHLWPNVVPQLLVIAFLEMGAVLLLIAELGFLQVFIGGGTRLPQGMTGAPVARASVPEWGLMLAQGTPFLRTKPFVIIGPALAFFLAIVGFNALGEGLRQLVENKGVDTSFLLRKRFYLAISLLALGTYLLVDYTGPDFWYARAAKAFEARRVAQWADALASVQEAPAAEDGASPTAVYLAERFGTLGLEPGWQPRLTEKSYTYTDNEGRSHVLGVWPGYDYDLADELVVVLTSYNESEENVADLALMLELVNHLQRQDVNPRRSLLFVAWEAGESGPSGIEDYLADPEHFRYLGSSSFGVSPAPALLLHLESDVTVEGPVLHVDTATQLGLLLTDSAERVDAGIRYELEQAIVPVMDSLPQAYVTWSGIDRQAVQAVGEALALTLIRLTRDAAAWQVAAEPGPAPVSTPVPTVVAPHDEEGQQPAVGLVELLEPEAGQVFAAGDTFQYAIRMRGAPGAYEEGQPYFGVRLRLTLRQEADGEQGAQIERYQGDVDTAGRYWATVTLPADLEPGDYTLTLTSRSDSYHGRPLELAGDTRITITVETDK